MIKTLIVKFDVSKLTKEQTDYLRMCLEVQGEDIPYVDSDGQPDYGHSPNRADAIHLSSDIVDMAVEDDDL